MVVEICIGSACHLKGSHQIVKKMQQLLSTEELNDKVELKSSFCLGRCAGGVSVRIDECYDFSLSPEQVEDFFNNEIMNRINERG